jgi:hypothetical protein
MVGNIRHLSIMVSFLFACVVVLIFCLSVSASDQVQTEVLFEIIDGTHMNIDVNVEVYSITLPANGITYTRSEIQSLSVSNPEMMGAIKISVKGLTLNQLKESFPESLIVSLDELPTYNAGVFSDSYRLSYLPSFFSLNESVDIDSYVNGFMDCGAFINYTFTLKSYDGWNQSFTFILPPSIDYKQTNGEVQQNHITWIVKTTGMPTEKNAQITLLSTNPTTSYSENESLHVHFFIDFKHPDVPALLTQLQGYLISIAQYDMIPDFISNLKSIPADAIRLSVFQNMTSWTTIKNQTFNPAFNHIKSMLENSSLNQTITPLFSWVNSTTITASEPFNISHMDTIPPIKANYLDNTLMFTICNISSRAVFGLINAGAQLNLSETDVNIGDNLHNIPFNYNGTLFFPKNILLNDQNIFHWDKNNPIKGHFSSINAEEYNKKKISSTFEIDMKSTDLNLLSFFTGRAEATIELYLKETQKRNITEIPFQFSLPEKIKLKLLNSDAFRVCADEQVFKEHQIQQFITYQKNLFLNRAKTLFPLIKGNAGFDQDSFDESLEWDKNISMMDGGNPIVVSSSLHTSFPLSFDFSFIPPRISMQPLNISFSGVTDQDVVYSMIFPKGVAVYVIDTLDRVEIKKTTDGNVYFSIYFNESEGGKIDNVLVIIHPSALYILSMFLPCIISVFIAIVLFVLLFIIRKKRKSISSSQYNGPTQDYEQEEYYIPPTPPSKRK